MCGRGFLWSDVSTLVLKNTRSEVEDHGAWTRRALTSETVPRLIEHGLLNQIDLVCNRIDVLFFTRRDLLYTVSIPAKVLPVLEVCHVGLKCD